MDSELIWSLASLSLKLSTAADIEQHLELLKSSNSVTIIILTGNTIGVEASERLAALLSKQKSLHTVKFDDIYTGRLLNEIPTSLDALLTALLECPKLTTIDLSDNAFGLNTVEPLVKFLRQHTPLKHLFLNNNGLGPEAGTLIANALTELAGKKQEQREKGQDVPDLETIVCGRNRLENGSAAAWAKTYQAHSSVRTVKMIQNGIRPDGIVVLIRDGLSHCSKLLLLDLQDNTFTESGSVALANALPKFRKLEELGIGDALLTNDGVIAIVDALKLKKNKHLTILRIQFAEMELDGLQHLIMAIIRGHHLPSLQRIELNGNKFPEWARKVKRLDKILLIRREHTLHDRATFELEPNLPDWGLGELDEMEYDSDFNDTDDEQYESDEWNGEDAPPISSDEEKDNKGLRSPVPPRSDTGVAATHKEVDVEKAGERILKEADEAESEPVAQEKDKEVDDLADALGKTII